MNKNPSLLVALSFLAAAVPSFAQSTGSPKPGRDASRFEVKFNEGAIVSLKRVGDLVNTDYAGGRRLGDLAIRYRPRGEGEWGAVQTEALAQSSGAAFTTKADGTEHTATYEIKNGDAPALEVRQRYVVSRDSVLWTLTLQNRSADPIEVGDLATPVTVGARGGGGGRRGGGTNAVVVAGGNAATGNTNATNANAGARRGGGGPVVLKHSLISGHGSYLFWMRSTNVGPYLMMLPVENTQLEYWEGGFGGFRVFIHSAAAGAIAKQGGTQWRQPNTSLTLAPKGKRGDSQTYQFKFRWADDYDSVRQVLVDEGKIDVQIVPGMTVPTNLTARFALRTKQKINSVEAEFPKQTEIESLGRKDGRQLYQVRFSRLGENKLTIHYGNNEHMFLEFFSTEPLETLIAKRGAFLARSQHRDPAKWYNGLITDWNMESHVLPSPDNYDRFRGFRIYAVTCDDPGLGKPAFLASKLAEFPKQNEVEALDYYIEHFVWGGLQRTTDEKYSYGIYGIQDWKRNRDSTDPGRNGQLHLWRVYDYPHIIVMYFGMYRVAKYHPEIKTTLTAKEYLQRAAGTALAMFTVPTEIDRGWNPYGTGFYNELVIVDLIRELQAAGMNDEADKLRGHWERKVKSFVNANRDLFRSEYAFDSTGFESTHALARYAMQHADQPGENNSGIPLANAERFMEKQMAANLFCRGVLETAYYYLGSDYRGGGGNAYTLTYMSQMGGWGVLDYALNYAKDPAPYLRLGYQSYLSAWALLNSGTPESNYGYWFPGEANDGGAGGGFEPAPSGMNWLQLPHHRGSWFYSCEIDLGYCGALRTAATVLTDDPIFGRFCFGGDWRKTRNGIEVMPKDGLRRRFHALLGDEKVSLVLDNDRFVASGPIVLKENLSEIRFQLESDNPAKHAATLRVSGTGKFTVRDGNGAVVAMDLAAGPDTAVELPIDASARPAAFVIQRR